MLGRIDCWRYETRCTRNPSDSSTKLSTSSSSYQHNINNDEFDSVSLSDDDYTLDQSTLPTHLTLRCSNTNDFLFIGLTQYGVSPDPIQCQLPRPNDCLVTVDYLANECNGLNSCRIQLDSQFLHSCKRHSDYLTLAYECIPGAQRVDVCANEETFLIDSTLNKAAIGGVGGEKREATSLSRFGAFYLTSPGYPNEYAANLANCSCSLEYVKIEKRVDESVEEIEANKRNGEINVALSAFEFDLEEGNEENSVNKCNKDFFRIGVCFENLILIFK